MVVNGGKDLLGYKHSSKYLPLCSAEQINLYRFGTTWGGVNDDRIFIFEKTLPLKTVKRVSRPLHCSSPTLCPSISKCKIASFFSKQHLSVLSSCCLLSTSGSRLTKTCFPFGDTWRFSWVRVLIMQCMYKTNHIYVCMCVFVCTSLVVLVKAKCPHLCSEMLWQHGPL